MTAGTGEAPRTDAASAAVNAITAAGGDVHQPDVSPVIARSWQRCSARGMRRDLEYPAPVPAGITPFDAAATRRYLTLVRPAMEDVYQFIEDSSCVVAYADSEARLLEVIGDPALRTELDASGWTAGGCWREECGGTNGLALALLESFPMQVVGEAHYLAMLHPYTTSAAPVYDSLGGLVGALVVVSPVGRAQQHTLGMVSAAANGLTGELRMNLWLGSANDLLAEMNAILQTLSEGIMLLHGDGTVAQMNARAGTLLGLAPAQVTGRRLVDVVEVPDTLADALRLGRELHDEELILRARGERIACLCTLRAIAAHNALPALTSFADIAGGPAARAGLQRAGSGLSVSPNGAVSGFVLTLRSIERVQRLVHRMAGAQALMRFESIVGESPQLLEAVRLARIAAQSTSTVLLHGETGTGKEVFAQAIHNGSARADGPFVAINCAAIPRELISSELFGYEGGAFTGADRRGRPGKFELANGGTLFLDEIGDMPRDLQTSLLRAIETRTVVRVGGQHVTPVDVRIITATHKDLAEEVRLENFRSDLFFRLNVFPIEVPALRERAGDVPALLRHILQRLSTRLNRTLGLEAEALAALETYDWPGNVRELENVIERAVYISERGIIGLADLPEAIRDYGANAPPLADRGSQFKGIGAAPRTDRYPTAGPSHERSLRHESEVAEAAAIQQVLRRHGGKVAQAAAELGISRTTLWRKMQRYHL
ncbi:MAG TPA: sigma 54-interacting transcriptional regulator [Ktedonobacterales bacterium]|nr:sigma 54-interacting transcriptional regulator [Ktedonobacterales bacterium]